MLSEKITEKQAEYNTEVAQNPAFCWYNGDNYLTPIYIAEMPHKHGYLSG